MLITSTSIRTQASRAQTAAGKSTAAKPSTAKPSTAKPNTAKEEGLAADLSDSLVRYHQLDGTKNGSRTEGVQFTPLVAADEKALKKHIADVSAYISKQDNVEFRPSPETEPGRGAYRQNLAKKSAAYVASSAQQMLQQATEMIADPALKAIVKEGLETAPKLFFSAPSSSSGKYHPADEINDGGLVLHTSRVVSMAHHLADFYQVNQADRDLLTAGLILHDTRKGGDANWTSLKDYAADHGDVAAKAILNLKSADNSKGKIVARLAANHMAQWTQVVDPAKPNGRSQSEPRVPSDKLEQIVSYADYLASQDSVYVLPPGYDAGYLKDIPMATLETV